MKIQIIGYSGSGKSTLAKFISKHFDLSLLYLDQVQFYGNWEERTFNEKENIIKEFLNNNSNWVIDGNYKNLCPERFELADVIIFLNFNRFACYRRARRRYKENIGKVRESSNCVEKFDLEFRYWLLVGGRKRNRWYKKLQECYKDKFIIIKSQKSLNLFKNNIDDILKKD